MLSVIMLNVVMLSVVAPYSPRKKIYVCFKRKRGGKKLLLPDTIIETVVASLFVSMDIVQYTMLCNASCKKFKGISLKLILFALSLKI